MWLFCLSLFVDNGVRGSLDTIDIAGWVFTLNLYITLRASVCILFMPHYLLIVLMKEEIEEAQLFHTNVQWHEPGETGETLCLKQAWGVHPFLLFQLFSCVFVLQFLVSEVKGLHHSLSCVAFIFVSLFAVQMLVSTKWVTLTFTDELLSAVVDKCAHTEQSENDQQSFISRQ